MTLKRPLMLGTSLALLAASLASMASVAPLASVAQDAACEDTVIFDLDRTIRTPENFNWFTPGTKRLHGAHQVM